MARGAKFGRAVGWAAGIGISNWVLQRRRATPTGETRIRVSAPETERDLKDEVYRLRGETVSIGGVVEVMIGTLAGRFARSGKRKPGAQWKALKGYLKSAGLKTDLQDEIDRVNGYFKPRNLAAHTGVMIGGLAGAPQILRLFWDKGDLRVDLLTLESLQEEVATAQAAHDGIRAIGRTLDGHQPQTLADMDDLSKTMLLG